MLFDRLDKLLHFGLVKIPPGLLKGKANFIYWDYGLA
jgi:hypothetical protein